MNDSDKARKCLRQIVDLFKSGIVPKALAMATIPPQAGIPSTKWSWSNKLLQFLADTSDARGYRQWRGSGRQVKKGAKAFELKAGDIMTPDCKRIRVDALAAEATALFHKYRIDELPVVDAQNRPIGLIDIQDVLTIKVVG